MTHVTRVERVCSTVGRSCLSCVLSTGGVKLSTVPCSRRVALNCALLTAKCGAFSCALLHALLRSALRRYLCCVLLLRCPFMSLWVTLQFSCSALVRLLGCAKPCVAPILILAICAPACTAALRNAPTSPLAQVLTFPTKTWCAGSALVCADGQRARDPQSQEPELPHACE